MCQDKERECTWREIEIEIEREREREREVEIECVQNYRNVFMSIEIERVYIERECEERERWKVCVERYREGFEIERVCVCVEIERGFVER